MAATRARAARPRPQRGGAPAPHGPREAGGHGRLLRAVQQRAEPQLLLKLSVAVGARVEVPAQLGAFLAGKLSVEIGAQASMCLFALHQCSSI